MSGKNPRRLKHDHYISEFFQCELFSLYENSENLMCVIQY